MLFVKLDPKDMEDDNSNTDGSQDSENTLVKQEVISSPLKGELTELKNVEDEAFACGVLGKGIAIMPTEGKVVAPADGVLTTLFPTGHAMGITTNNGAEILIHVGMDTVKLEGKHFTLKAKQGDTIKKGQTLVEFDINAIEKEGYSLITPVIITNSDNYLDVVETTNNSVDAGDELLTVVH